MSSENQREETLKIDYDGTWKEFIRVAFPSFSQFFLPTFSNDIDFSVEPEHLDLEFENILKHFYLEKRRLDKLIKVKMLTGKDCLILLHVEIQSYFEKEFAKRMFELSMIIRERYHLPVVALAIYTNDQVPKQYNLYEEKLYGTELQYKFNAYKIEEQQEEDLVKSDNIFSLFVLAHKYINRTKVNNETRYKERLRLKEKIFELALERNISKFDAAKLLAFIDNIMLLPTELTEKFNYFLYEKTKEKMTSETEYPDIKEALKASRLRFTDIFVRAIYGEEIAEILRSSQRIDRKLLQEKLVKEAIDNEFRELNEQLELERQEKLKAQKQFEMAEKQREMSEKQHEKEQRKAQKQLETERRKVQKQLETERRKAQEHLEMEQHKIIKHLFEQKMFTIEYLAQFFNLPLEAIQKIVQTDNDSTDKTDISNIK